MKYTLFQIGEEIRALAELLMETGGEITDPEAETAIDDWLAETQISLERKANQYAWLIREFEGRSEARELAAKALMANAAADSNQALRLKARLKNFMEISGLKKLETEHFKLWIQANGGKAPLIVPPSWEQEPELAPESFRKVEVKLDKEVIRRAVEDFNKQAELATAKAETSEERRRLFKEWIERDEAARKQKDLIEGCAIGERGYGIRIR